MQSSQKEYVENQTKYLKMIQKIQVQMLYEIDRICEKYGIKYNIIGGTLLGAVRHQEHIPWDDDADVAMLREEYERFKMACLLELNKDKYYFQCIEKTYGYRWGYAKLRRKDTVFLRVGQEHMPYDSGIFIDIFPVDNVPNNIILNFLHQGACFLLRKILWSRVGCKTETNLIKKIAYIALNKIPESAVKKIYSWLVEFSRSLKSDRVRCLTFPLSSNAKYGYYKKWYLHRKKYNFSGIKLWGVAEYDCYLRCKYGNYMELPPESERKIHLAAEIKISDKVMKEDLH